MPSALPNRRNTMFWNRIAKRYARSPIADETTYQRKLSETRALLRPDMHLLEIGTGTGSTAITHAPHVAHILAIDLAKSMVDIAQQKADAAGIDNVTFTQSSIEGFAAPDASYDMILALSVLHLVQDRDATLARMFRMLKPGGFLVSSTACLKDGMSLFRLITVPGHWLSLLPRVVYFSRSELENAITAAGFEIRTCWQPGPRRAPFCIAQKPE